MKLVKFNSKRTFQLGMAVLIIAAIVSCESDEVILEPEEVENIESSNAAEQKILTKRE